MDTKISFEKELITWIGSSNDSREFPTQNYYTGMKDETIRGFYLAEANSLIDKWIENMSLPKKKQKKFTEVFTKVCSYHVDLQSKFLSEMRSDEKDKKHLMDMCYRVAYKIRGNFAECFNRYSVTSGIFYKYMLPGNELYTIPDPSDDIGIDAIAQNNPNFNSNNLSIVQVKNHSTGHLGLGEMRTISDCLLRWAREGKITLSSETAETSTFAYLVSYGSYLQLGFDKIEDALYKAYGKWVKFIGPTELDDMFSGVSVEFLNGFKEYLKNL